MDEKLKSNRLDSIINRVCGDCGRAGAESNGIKLEGGAHTFSMGICDFCGEKKYLTSVRNFGYPDFNLLKVKKMNRKEKIKTIYEKIARKDLRFGCKFKFTSKIDEFKKNDEALITKAPPMDFISFTKDCENIKNITPRTFVQDTEIIGHPVMIGDVMDYFAKNNFHFAIGNSGKMIGNKNKAGTYFEFIWNDFLKPIEEQSDECIDFVYDLIFK